MSSSSASLKSIPRSVIALGLVSLCMDASSEMIHSLLPVFMISTLGASALAVGVIEGIGEATASITKVFSGVISDWIGKRKILVLAGYSLAAFTKPLFAVAQSIHAVLAARFIDRIGKGIRGAPRDALMTDLVTKEQHGAAFGLRQSMDTVGAFLGPIAAMALMFLTADNYRAVFWIAFIPALAAILFIVFGVQEPEKLKTAAKKPFPIQKKELAKLPVSFWVAVVFASAFTLARFSEAFLILRASVDGLSPVLVPLVLIVMNVVYSASAYPVGKLSDRIGKNGLLAGGLVVLIAADLLLAGGGTLWMAFAGTILWGLHMGMTEGLLSALIADKAPDELRGTAFGMFNLLKGIVGLVASALAGELWVTYGPAETFIAGAIFAAIALLGLWAVRGRHLQ